MNLVAPFALTQACLRLLKRSADASVIFTSEIHGQVPAPFLGRLCRCPRRQWKR